MVLPKTVTCDICAAPASPLAGRVQTDTGEKVCCSKPCARIAITVKLT